jgi:hypothetical protein
VNGAEAACLFLLSERTVFQAGVGIGQQGAAFGAQFPVSFLVPAIESDHLFYNTFLLGDA